MPLDRSPLRSAAHTAQSLQKQQQYGSAPNLSENYPVQPVQAANRQKRKRSDSIDARLDRFMNEMKEMFRNFEDKQIKQVEEIISTVDEIKVQNCEFRQTIDFLSEKYDSLQRQMTILEQERDDKIQIVKKLEDKLEMYEKQSRSTCVEIKNVPIQKSETKETLLKTLRSITDTLNMDFQPQQVKDIYRIGTKDPENKTIIVDFVSNLTKENMLRVSKRYNKEKGKLTTERLKFSGTSKPVFISENLTPKMKRIFFLARDYAKTNNYEFCWTSNGKIFIREKQGGPLYYIREEADLCKLNRKP